MIPWLAIVRVRGRDFGWPLTLWIPLFLIWLLLLPFALLLAPLLLIAALFLGINPWSAIVTGWELLASLRGLKVEVRDHETNIKIVVC